MHALRCFNLVKFLILAAAQDAQDLLQLGVVVYSVSGIN